MAATAESLDFDFGLLPEIGNGWLDRLGAIREADPVFWSERQHGWLITRHADLIDGFGGRVPLSAARLDASQLTGIPAAERADKIPHLLRSLPDWIINADPPAHTRMRRLMGKAFSRKVVESVREFARRTIDELFDDLEARGQAECNEDVARLITGKTILHLLGVPQEYLPKLKGWSESVTGALAIVNAGEALLMNGERAVAEMFDLFAAEIEQRRGHPGTDIFTGLMQAIDGTDQLSMSEMVGSSVVLLLAGHDTTLNSIVLGVETLARHPEQRAWLAAHPEEGDKAVVELMRYFAMAGGQTRLVAEDFDWHGKHLKKGDIVYLMIAAGNRDPRAFDRPDELDFSRENAASLTFAPGTHHCIGHMLARMQMTEFFTRAYARFETIEVLEPEIRFSPVWVFRSIPKLDIRFHPRKLAKAA